MLPDIMKSIHLVNTFSEASKYNKKNQIHRNILQTFPVVDKQSENGGMCDQIDTIQIE